MSQTKEQFIQKAIASGYTQKEASDFRDKKQSSVNTSQPSNATEQPQTDTGVTNTNNSVGGNIGKWIKNAVTGSLEFVADIPFGAFNDGKGIKQATTELAGDIGGLIKASQTNNEVPANTPSAPLPPKLSEYDQLLNEYKTAKIKRAAKQAELIATKAVIQKRAKELSALTASAQTEEELKILENLKAKLADSIKEYQKAAELLNKGTTTTAKK